MGRGFSFQLSTSGFRFSALEFEITNPAWLFILSILSIHVNFFCPNLSYFDLGTTNKM